jgi:hypothetical protein
MVTITTLATSQNPFKKKKKKKPWYEVKITPQGSKRERPFHVAMTSKLGFCKNGIRYPASCWYPQYAESA